MIEQRKKGLEMKKVRKQAVLKIEAARYKQLHIRECRQLRKYLAKLPFECRTLYFKFIQCKRSQNVLMNEFVGYMQDQFKLKVVDTVNLKYAPM